MTDESQLSVEVITVDKRPQIPAEVLGEKVTESPTFREVFTLDVENVAADGSGTVKATFTELELSGVSLVTKLLEGIEDIGEVSLEGGNFRMTLCQDGRVTTVTGMNALADEVSEKQMKAMLKQAERLPRQSRDEFESRIAQVKDALGTMAGALLGDDSTRERMEGWLNIYPASPVRVGDTWNKTRATYNPFAPIVIADTWQLKESRDGVATLERRADITPNNQAPPLEILGLRVRMGFTGKVTGTVEVDEKTGWILLSTMTSDVRYERTIERSGGGQVRFQARMRGITRVETSKNPT